MILQALLSAEHIDELYECVESAGVLSAKGEPTYTVVFNDAFATFIANQEAFKLSIMCEPDALHIVDKSQEYVIN